MSGAGAGLEDYASAWKALSRRDRSALIRLGNGGRRAGSRWDAAMMLWWTSQELRRGPWPGVRLAVAFVGGILLFLWLVGGIPPHDVGAVVAAAPLLPILPLIPIAAFTFRRPRLQRAAHLNAAVLSDRKLAGPPDAAQTERLLVRARNKGWFKGRRPGPER